MSFTLPRTSFVHSLRMNAVLEPEEDSVSCGILNDCSRALHLEGGKSYFFMSTLWGLVQQVGRWNTDVQFASFFHEEVSCGVWELLEFDSLGFKKRKKTQTARYSPVTSLCQQALERIPVTP